MCDPILKTGHNPEFFLGSEDEVRPDLHLDQMPDVVEIQQTVQRSTHDPARTRKASLARDIGVVGESEIVVAKIDGVLSAIRVEDIANSHKQSHASIVTLGAQPVDLHASNGMEF